MGFIATNIDKICGKCNFFNPKCCTNEKLGLPLHSLTKTARTGAVVQLVRIHACHAWGRGFESRPHRKSLKQCFGLFSFFPKKQTTMKLRLILIALMALLAFNASETSLADNNTRTSGNTTTGTGYFQNGRPFVVISKEEMKMRVYDATGRELRCYPIACGRNVGNKRRHGDMRTPVGLFKVQEILDAHTWTHDFKDGKGVIRGAYGPYFVRLLTGHKGIGIHGTHDESSIGTLATEGCIHLHNANILEFATKFAYRGMTVIVLPSKNDLENDGLTLETENGSGK